MHCHLVGIGGIGMSASRNTFTAQYPGKRLDLKESEITRELSGLGLLFLSASSVKHCRGGFSYLFFRNRQ